MLGLLFNALPETQLIADPDHRAAALFFSVLNAGALILAILAGRDRSRPRTAERLLASESAVCELEDRTRVLATVRDASASGARIEWPRDQPVPRSIKIHLTRNHAIFAAVVRQDGNTLGVRFELADAKERERILLWVYSISVGAVQAPLSLKRLAGSLAARCLK
jgi:cellulose synthase (UDP-forming)